MSLRSEPENERRTRQAPPARRYLQALSRSLRPWLILALVCALFSLHPGFRAEFWTRDYLPEVLQQSARNTVLAVGMSFVILTGGIDLSVGSVLALSGVGVAIALTGSPTMPRWLVGLAMLPISTGAAWLAGRFVPGASRRRRQIGLVVFIVTEVVGGMLLARGIAGGVQVEAAVVVALLIGAGCGLTNGLIVSIGRVPSFVVTLGMMSAARGLTLYATDGVSISTPFPRFTALGEGAPLILTTLVVVLLGAILLARTRAGRYILSTGGNEEASRLSGVSVVGAKTLAYVLSGLAAGLAAILVTAKFGTAQTNAGTGAELDAIAAVVIGGASLSGGQGSIIGALVGALTITVITSGLVLVGIKDTLQPVILGGVIVLTVFADQMQRLQRRK